MMVTRPAASRPMTPAATFFNRISMSRFWVEMSSWDCAQLPIGRGQLGLALLQVLGHFVEGLHQEADFVPPFLVDVEIVVAPRHLHGAFGQLADGGGDLPGHVKPQPDGGHHGDEGDDDQGQVMAHLDRAEVQLALAQVLEAAGRVGDAQQMGLGDELAHQQVALEVAGGVASAAPGGSRVHPGPTFCRMTASPGRSRLRAPAPAAPGRLPIRGS